MEHPLHSWPLVSIAVATFNGEKFIGEQIDSLVKQTYPNLEIIISDDGSTDGTMAIIKQYADLHRYIRLFTNQGEQGVRKNFENALQYCSADYIALCDQDDVWMPEKIERLMHQIGPASLIYHDSLLVDSAGKSLHRKVVVNQYAGKDPKVFLLANVVSGHACLFKKSLLKQALPFPREMYPDWWLAAIAADQDGVAFCADTLVHYRQHDNNTSDFMGTKACREPNDACKMHLEDIQRFSSFKRLKKHNAFFNAWYVLNKKRTSKWFCFRLFVLCFANRASLFYLYNKSELSLFFRCLAFLWGFMLKRIFDRKYHFEDSFLKMELKNL